MLESVAQTLTIALPESLPQGDPSECRGRHAAYLAKVQAALRRSAITELPCNGGLPYGYTLTAAQFRELTLPVPALAFSYPVSSTLIKHPPPPGAHENARHIVLCVHRLAETLPGKIRLKRAPHGGLSIFMLRKPISGDAWLLEPSYQLIPYLRATALKVTLSPRIIPFQSLSDAPFGAEAKLGPLAEHAIGVALQAIGQMTDHGERGFQAPPGCYRA